MWLPRHLVLEVTNQCNLNCVMCERRLTQPDNLMSWSTFSEAMKSLAPGFVAVELSGLGEPTLAPLFGKMVKTVREADKVLYFPTNGAAISKVVDELDNSDKTRVNFSMDAATAETYGKIRVDKVGKAASFDDLLKSVELFRAKRDKARLITSFTAAAYNVDEFPQFVALARQLGANQVFFKPARCWALKPEEQSLRYRKDRTERALQAALELAGDLSVVVERPYYAAGFENSGEIPGFINYLDILPLDVLECGGGTGGTDGGTTTSIDTGTLTYSSGVGPDFFGDVEIVGNQVIIDSLDLRGKTPRYSDNIALVTADGEICSCAARHPIGVVGSMSFKELVEHPRYQAHLTARSELGALKSAWCRSCEKMM